MKKLAIKMCLAAMLMMPVTAFAQEVQKALSSDEAMKAQYEGKIKALDSEIKSVKAKIKENPTDNTLKDELQSYQNEKSDWKAKRDVMVKSIKSQKAKDKAIQKAEKAKQNAEKAKKDAEKAAADAQKAATDANNLKGQ